MATEEEILAIKMMATKTESESRDSGRSEPDVDDYDAGGRFDLDLGMDDFGF